MSPPSIVHTFVLETMQKQDTPPQHFTYKMIQEFLQILFGKLDIITRCTTFKDKVSLVSKSYSKHTRQELWDLFLHLREKAIETNKLDVSKATHYQIQVDHTLKQ
jgi:hypothetical protein